MSWGLSFDVRKITSQQSQPEKKEHTSEISEERQRSLGVKLDRSLRYQDRKKEEEAAQRDQRERHEKQMMSLKNASNRLIELAVPRLQTQKSNVKAVFVKPTIRQRFRDSINDSVSRMQSTTIHKARERTKDSKIRSQKTMKTQTVRERTEEQVVVPTMVSRWVFEKGEWLRKEIAMEDTVTRPVIAEKQIRKEVVEDRERWGWSTYKRQISDTSSTFVPSDTKVQTKEEKENMNIKVSKQSIPRVMTDKYSVEKPNYKKYISTRKQRQTTPAPEYVQRLETKHHTKVISVTCELPRSPTITIGQINQLALPHDHKRTSKYITEKKYPIPVDENTREYNRQRLQARPNTACSQYSKKKLTTIPIIDNSTNNNDSVFNSDDTPITEMFQDAHTEYPEPSYAQVTDDPDTPDDTFQAAIPLHIPKRELSPDFTPTSPREIQYSPKYKPLAPPAPVQPVMPRKTIRTSAPRVLRVSDDDYTMEYLQY